MTDEVQLIHYGSREDWLQARKNGIGASEAAALFGLSPWHSELSLWTEKRDLDTGERAESEWMEIGNLMEPVVAELYQRRTSRALWSPNTSWAIARHRTFPWMFASVDRWIIDAAGKPGRGVLEMKNVGFGMSHEWDDGPPLKYQIQIQMQLAVTGFQWGSLAGILGGNKFISVDVERNDDFIAELEELCGLFWERVQQGTMPTADGSDATARALKRLYPKDSGAAVHLDNESAKAWDTLADARRMKAAAEKTEKAVKNQLAKSFGDATFGVLPDKRLISYRTHERDGYAVDPTTYRQFKEEKRPTSSAAFVDEVNKHAEEQRR